jgi:hypothetical protein
LPPFHIQQGWCPAERNEIIYKRKIKQKCQGKNAHTNHISAAARVCMALESACQLRMDGRFWPAAGRKGVINLPFLMNTEAKNKLKREIIL